MFAVSKKFLTPHEVEVLLSYGKNVPMQRRNVDSITQGLREQARLFWENRDYPTEVIDVYNRICEVYDLHDRQHTEGMFAHVCRYHEGARTLEHFDRKEVLGGRTFRSNIVVQNAEEGGEFTYMGEVRPTPVGALFVFDASELHAVLPTKKGMRIVFRWGWRDL